MSITSLVFILFVFATLILYFAVPKKSQWGVLLISSLVFYVLSSKWGIIYILVTATSVFGAGVLIDNNLKKSKAYIKENKETLSKEEKSAYKKTNKNKRKRYMIACLILNVGILCVLKYSHFAVEQINTVLSWFGAGALGNDFKWLAPLGLSFYTFQSVGYIVDVYWEKIPAQRNYLKMLLFVSFFPQVTQGPISEYGQLSAELFKEHKFTYENYSRGFQRMIWGFFKKMVIANMLSVYVNDVFANYESYLGITCAVGILAYSVQIYADFSGYMDIMCGICETLDIKLAENFMRPYFSKSIAEYWRRWHITLGVWFKNYIYYPIGVSKWAQNLGKKLKKLFGQKVAQNVPATIALLLVWFLTGLWHGASFGYIIWGLVNGFIIIFSMWMEPVYEKTKKALHINESAWLWRAFQVLRTFALVSIIKVIPEVGSLSKGLGLIKRAFTNFTITTDYTAIFTTAKRSRKIEFLAFFAFLAILFVFELLQRKKPIRDYFNRIKLPFRIIIIGIACVILIMYKAETSGIVEDFMYAQF